MPSFISTVVALAVALASITFASPLHNQTREGFTVHQTDRISFTPGRAELRNAYRKYGGYKYSHYKRVAATFVPNAGYYLSPVSFGGQILNVNFDTGSIIP